MVVEHFILSAMCHYPEASVYGITKFKRFHFTGLNKDAFTLIKTLYKKDKSVQRHVFVSQMSAYGMSEPDANLLFSYCENHPEDWKPVFESFAEVKVYDKMMQDIQELDEMRSEKKSVDKVSAKASQFASEWITQTEKRYYSGQEVDESQEEYGAPIRTGIPDYDDKLYKHGGNLKGQMKGVICREKHGKTRSECWEVAHNIRMGYKVLYVTMEGIKKDIAGNIKEVLRHEWKNYRNNLFVVDGVVDVDEIESIIVESVLVEGVDKVVIDYAQLMTTEKRVSGENERINYCIERLRNLMIKHNFHLTLLSQSRKESQYRSVPKDSNGEKMLPDGWSGMPGVDDAYGSNALIKAASLILSGFRPNLVMENRVSNGLSKKIIDPFGNKESYYSFYLQAIRMRYKPEYLHKFIHFIDGDEGLKIQGMI